MKKKELLAVSFGTSFPESRKLTIGAVEDRLKERFSDEYTVKRAFTSPTVIRLIESREQIRTDSVEEALNRALDQGVEILLIQPTHFMNGLEYKKLVQKVSEYQERFSKIAIGKPLLDSETDFDTVMRVITEAASEYDDGKTAVCLMGHGSEAAANSVYKKLQDLLWKTGYKNYFIGTVEAEPSLETVMENVRAGNYERVVLEPLMIVAGDHANHDMAGGQDGSWKTEFEKAGYEVICLLKGLGEFEAVQNLFVKHAEEAAAALK